MSEDIVKSQGLSVELVRALEGLSVGEALAMNCLMSGGTMIAAAEAADVTRRSLYEWLEPGRPLHEALTVWKQDLASTARTRLLMMTDLATQNILSALKRGDAKLAMNLVQKLGVLSAPPVGPTHVEVVTEGVVGRNKAEELEGRGRKRAVSFVEQWTEVSYSSKAEVVASLEGSGGGADEGECRKDTSLSVERAVQ